VLKTQDVRVAHETAVETGSDRDGI
jgi:hypothetical protein